MDFLKPLLALFHTVFDPVLIPLGRLWKSEPIRILYVIAVGLQAFATLSTGGQPLQAVLQGVLIAVIGEIQRQQVFSPKTVEALVDQAAATGVPVVGSPPDASPPLPPRG